MSDLAIYLGFLREAAKKKVLLLMDGPLRPYPPPLSETLEKHFFCGFPYAISYSCSSMVFCVQTQQLLNILLNVFVIKYTSVKGNIIHYTLYL